MYYPDLSPCRHLARDERLLAVGWLEPGHPLPQGTVPDEFVSALAQLLGHTWEPARCCGGLFCGFCPTQQGYSSANLIVWSKDRAYVSPEGILHYVRAHRYQPPTEFIDAVLQCPPLASIEYFEGLERFGLLQQSPEKELKSFLDEQRAAVKFIRWRAQGSRGPFELD